MLNSIHDNTTIRALIAIGLVGVFSICMRLRADDTRKTSAVSVAVANQTQAGKSQKPEFKGPQTCGICHAQAATPNPLLLRDFCLLAEVPTLLNKDKHAKAYQLLDSELGKKISERLKPLGYQEATKEKRCLSCHANWRYKEGNEKPPAFFELGVTCESCHGPSSLWVDPHYKVEWREKPVAEKEQLGMVDVRNPISRSKQCFSCHIDNVVQGKVFTHEMYAAGHPPLPGIEIETFASEMPPHWRHLREKGDFLKRKEFIAATYGGISKTIEADLPRSKSVIIGGVIALRESLHLFASQLKENQSQGKLELAIYDCQACHHDLRSPGWRQRRTQSKQIPGRPQLMNWPSALVKIGVRHLAKDDEMFRKKMTELRTHEEQLQDAMNTRAFGDQQKCEAAINGENGYVAWLDRLATSLLQSRFDKESTQRAIVSLCEFDETELPDYHSARQIVWAVRIMAAELSINYPQFEKRPKSNEPENFQARSKRESRDIALFQDWQTKEWTAGQKRLDELFQEFKLYQPLVMQLPSGQDRQINKELSAALQSISEYDPVKFKNQLKLILPRLLPNP